VVVAERPDALSYGIFRVKTELLWSVSAFKIFDLNLNYKRAALHVRIICTIL